MIVSMTGSAFGKVGWRARMDEDLSFARLGGGLRKKITRKFESFNYRNERSEFIFMYMDNNSLKR